MKTKSLIFSTGLALFSMFFGSGNLVFPLMVGQESGGHFNLATIGILLTGVFVPLLGVFAMLLFNGNVKDFFGRVGKPAVFWFPLIALSLMGPFGVLARCITVAHGAFNLIAPSTLVTFSGIACALIFVLTISKSRIVPLLGSLLTPVLLASLAAIAIFGMIYAPSVTAVSGMGLKSFVIGIFQGYQTMDLLAAFFFSAFIIKHLKDRTTETTSVFLKSAFVGAGLLSAVYFALVYLGSAFSTELATTAPQEMLGEIALLTLGSAAAPVVASAVILACLTTAIVLTSLFADFLRTEIAKDKIPNSISLLITLIIAFTTSTLGFSGIARILGPILETIYPALIVLTVLGILHKLWGLKTIRVPIAIAFLTKILTAI